MPWRAWRSEPQIPQRRTDRRTCPWAGTGSGASTTSSSAFWQTTALIAATLTDLSRMDHDGTWERRVANQEINGRRVNEAIERGRLGESPGGSFVCECGRIGCNVTLTLSTEEYEAVRTDFDRFVIVPGHELPPVDKVVERHDGYFVVIKVQDEAREMAKETDPR